MRLLWGKPGNEAIVGRAWELDYCGERLGMRQLCGAPGNETIVWRAWEQGHINVEYISVEYIQ